MAPKALEKNMSDETRVATILREFLADAVPEYIQEGARELLGHGIQKLNLKKSGSHWDVEGTIQGEDFQTYSPKLSIDINEGTINPLCNCEDSFSSVCRHVAAVAMKLLETLESVDTDTDTPQAPVSRNEWRQTFRPFFATALEPESGRHYLIFRIYPEPGRLQVALFRARQNKSGLSTVHAEITLEQLLQNPEWCDLSPELPKIAELIGHNTDYYGHRIDIPDGLLNWFFWGIRKEYFVFWEDTDNPCRISTHTMQLKINPEFKDGGGLHFILTLHQENKPPLPISGSNITFHGQTPLWICWKRTFYPVHTDLPLPLLRVLLEEPPVVSQEDIPEFLDRVWTKLPSSSLHGQEDFLERMEPVFIPSRYAPKLYLDEEGSLLTVTIQNIYETIHGEFELPGPNPDFQTGSYTHEGGTYLLRREQEEENALLSVLIEMKFLPRSSRVWFLEPEEAINFLLDAYPSLVEKYRVYGEKALSRYKVRLSQPVINTVLTSNEKDKWFNLDVTVQYDEQNVALEEVWRAWVQGKRYVQLKDGSYTSLPKAWLEKVGHKLQVLGFDPDKPPKQKFEQFEVSALDSLLDDMPNAVTDSFWQTLRSKIHDFKGIDLVAPPKGLNATLRPYQVQGLSYLNFLREYGFGGILADEMGLGKTIQTLSFIQLMLERGAEGPNLIVVPTSVLPNWEREAEKFVPGLKRLVIYGTRRENMFTRIDSSDLVMTTYALLRRDLEELEKHEFNAIFLDEAQNIKNPNTITAKSVRNIKAGLKICLSGTPIENNLFELWSLFEFLMPGFLGAQHAFQRGVVRPIKEGDSEPLEFLRSRVKPFILRRTKSEVAKDLPPKVENTYYCALAEEQAELYGMLTKRLKEQIMASVDEKGIAKSQISILDALLKLRQICCHPRLLKLNIPGVNTNLPSGKFDAFKDMVTDIVEEGHKVLVFSQFVQMLHIIRSWLQISEIPFCYLDGTSKDRFEQVDKFNNSPEIPIFLISLKAGGTGLNLTGADYVIHYDPWWNPAMENQATDRTHRIGQTRQVFAYKLICQNTVEEKILQLQESKRGMAEAIIPGQNSWKSLTRDDLEMLFDV
ncbi:SNF2-related protein [uncultured delta proteobacterium]|uniref:SNF2-related protein n=1 Tax=uncultured delta proteobacterium TaxID=34034 RepID=A0A212IZG4_9DELT|nr:SNF2-related protein [uncultured delta proteobacterium]